MIQVERDLNQKEVATLVQAAAIIRGPRAAQNAQRQKAVTEILQRYRKRPTEFTQLLNWNYPPGARDETPSL